jgi:hypothetical protein
VLAVQSRVAMVSRLACLATAMTFSAVVAAESESTQLAVATAALTRTRGAHVSPRNPCRMKYSTSIRYSPCKHPVLPCKAESKESQLSNSALERCTSKPSFDSPAANFRSHTRTRSREKISAPCRQNSSPNFVLTRAPDPEKRNPPLAAEP